MPLRRTFYCTLTLSLFLGACASPEKTPDTGVGKPPLTSERTARALTAVSRPGSGKPTPFANEEEKRIVYFALGGTSIEHEASEILRENARQLKDNPQLVVTLVGHTDNLGSAGYNLAVADKRIDAVSERLRSLGVARNQIRRLPLGSEESSKLKCDSEACRRLMRKVELIYEWR